MDKPFQRTALNEAVRDYIKRYIVENKLNGGDPLPPETHLAQDLGVGRSSVREAIKGLQSLGIVEARQGDGLYVRDYNFDPVVEILSFGLRSDPRRLAELMQIRLWLEVAVIGDAVKLLSEADLAELDALIVAWEERVQSGEPHADLDERFHYILYAALDNPTLLKLIEVFWVSFDELQMPAIRESAPAVEVAHHRAILEAVKAQDVELARRRLAEHFAPLRERISTALQAPEPTAAR